MVSFSCEACGDVLTKKSLDKHRSQCRGASFTCLDCMVNFQGTDYRSHTSCISEAQKYQGALYKEKDKKGRGEKRKSVTLDESQAMVPRRAYVEDAPDGDDSQAVAIIDVPPRAPTPPSAAEPVVELPENVNVFDFLVKEVTPNGTRTNPHGPDERRILEQSVHCGNGDSQHTQVSKEGSQYLDYGFSYGNSPVPPSMDRYDSWQNLTDSQYSQAMPPPSYVTPAPKEHRREKKDRPTKTPNDTSDKKRKRQQVEELDLSSSSRRPSSRDQLTVDAPRDASGRVLHSGLTGGLHKLVTDPDFYEDRIEAGPTPILSPIKRSRRDDDGKKDRRKSSYITYSTVGSSRAPPARYPDDKTEHSRTIERKYYDDKHHRARSADRMERVYRDDKHRHRRHRESSSSDDRPHRKQLKAIDYPSRPTSVQPSANNQIVKHSTRADLFLSFITKGPDSEHGCSFNKALKRYHRERDVRGERKEEDNKDLWKDLRLRRNDRGEIVLFI